MQPEQYREGYSIFTTAHNTYSGSKNERRMRTKRTIQYKRERYQDNQSL